MELVLAEFGTSFATRERAREVAATLGSPLQDETVVIDLDGVNASPSFLAELLMLLSVRYVSLAIEGGSDHLRKITFSLVEKLGLGGRVRAMAR